jgi:hypothetical protein
MMCGIPRNNLMHFSLDICSPLLIGRCAARFETRNGERALNKTNMSVGYAGSSLIVHLIVRR